MADFSHLKIFGEPGDENNLYGGDYTGLDVASLEDQPSLSANELKDRFDALVKRLVVPRFNALLDALYSNSDVRMRTIDVETPAHAGFSTQIALADVPFGTPIMCQAAYDIAEPREERTPYPLGAFVVTNNQVVINWSENTGTSVTVPVTFLWRVGG
jgi:hypothetical protein